MALSPADQNSLSALLSRLLRRPPRVHILIPPLRADVSSIAQRQQQLQQAPPSENDAATQAYTAERKRGTDAEEALQKLQLPEEFWAALTAPGPARRFVTCAVRLSREKNPMGFVKLVEGALQVGTPSCTDALPLLAPLLNPALATLRQEPAAAVCLPMLLLSQPVG